MPRVENLGANVNHWHKHEARGEGSSTFDVCRSCWHDLDADAHAYDAELTPYNGDPDGTDGRGGDIGHPPYEDGEYECEVCHETLTDDDN